MSNDLIKTPQNKIVQFAKSDTIKTRFNEVFNNLSKTNSFLTSLINIVNNSKSLQNCDYETVFGAALVAASLDLPVNPTLGFAYLLPYGSKCQLILGYKAYIQLAIRSGHYKSIHCSSVYEDELDYYNYLTGEIKFTDQETWNQRNNEEDDKIVGYYSCFKLLNAFEKQFYMTINKVQKHAVKYSKSYTSTSSTNIWKSDFNSMALKTVVRQLLRKWGILSIEMQTALKSDSGAIDMDENITYDDNPKFVLKEKEEVAVKQIDQMISGGGDETK